MDHYMPALRLPALRLRTSPKELQDKDTHSASYDGLPTVNHSGAQSQISPGVPSLRISTQNCPSVSSLPRSPPDHSPASFHSCLSSPTSSVASSQSSLRSAPPILRRKISPTETSLREIRASQQLLQMKQSEDQLRELYERQTMEYLYGDYASLDGLRE
jgi:hypothetical protein